MKHLISTLAIALLFITNSIGQNTGDSPQTKLGFTKTIESKILKDSLNLFIHLPFNYKENREFPLIVLLDAHTTFKAFSACTELMAYGRSIPTCIVVGFPQYKYANFDSSNIKHKMDKIAGFMSKELLPYLNSKYNITQTIIWGQGSEITTYLMLHKPNLFDGYIADVPDLGLISEEINSENTFENLRDKTIDYFLFESKDEENNNKAFLSKLKASAPEGLNWHYHISHESNMIIYLLNNYMQAIELFFNTKQEQNN